MYLETTSTIRAEFSGRGNIFYEIQLFRSTYILPLTVQVVLGSGCAPRLNTNPLDWEVPLHVQSHKDFVAVTCIPLSHHRLSPAMAAHTSSLSSPMSSNSFLFQLKLLKLVLKLFSLPTAKSEPLRYFLHELVFSEGCLYGGASVPKEPFLLLCTVTRINKQENQYGYTRQENFSRNTINIPKQIFLILFAYSYNPDRDQFDFMDHLYTGSPSL